MKKAERLHQMLKYVNEKKRFTLRELMEEFHISKRTALRDVASLEQMGAPIYAEYGRSGGYRLLAPVRLPPISFASEEVYALYISLQMLESVTDLPFQTSYSSIHQKFMDALTEQQREQVRRIRNRVRFHVTKQATHCPWLETVLVATMENRGLHMMYRGSMRRIQPLSVYLMRGYWYCQSVDLDKQSYRVFRCDRIEHAELADLEMELAGELPEDGQPLWHWRPSENAVPFKCLLDRKGVERFRLDHYPSMGLVEEQGRTYLAGTFEPDELDFILHYLSSFGTSLKVVEPAWLKERLREYYLHLIEHL